MMKVRDVIEKWASIILLIFSSNSSLSVYGNDNSTNLSNISHRLLVDETLAMDDSRNREYCFMMQKKYNIVPGASYGQLPVSMHKEYTNVKCCRFFCKPHPKCGNGGFKCEPLELTPTTT